jgi:hypothetical protein
MKRKELEEFCKTLRPGEKLRVLARAYEFNYWHKGTYEKLEDGRLVLRIAPEEDSAGSWSSGLTYFLYNRIKKILPEAGT